MCLFFVFCFVFFLLTAKFLNLTQIFSLFYEVNFYTFNNMDINKPLFWVRRSNGPKDSVKKNNIIKYIFDHSD